MDVGETFRTLSRRGKGVCAPTVRARLWMTVQRNREEAWARCFSRAQDSEERKKIGKKKSRYSEGYMYACPHGDD